MTIYNMNPLMFVVKKKKKKGVYKVSGKKKRANWRPICLYSSTMTRTIDDCVRVCLNCRLKYINIYDADFFNIVPEQIKHYQPGQQVVNR